ncbi:MAG: nucleoside recognition domain-containing protein [Huintestinicola sp.]
MINAVLAVLIIISAAAAFYCGSTDKLTEAILNEPVSAVELAIYLSGGMCFWGGLMRVAEKSGLTDKLAWLFGFLLGGLFKNLDRKGAAFKAICMNLTANLLGLGNAATPFGIQAMKEIAKEEKNLAPSGTATPSMIIFTVMNTASVTLIPSTAASLRLKYGSEVPLDILPAVWITSVAALTVSLAAAVIPLFGKSKKR